MMKRFFLGVLFFFIFHGFVSAHPVDISSFVISLPISELSSHTLPLTWSVTIPEALTLTRRNPNADPPSNLEIPSLKPLLAKYLQEHFEVKTSKGICMLDSEDDATLEEIDLTLVTYKTSLICPEAPTQFTIHTTSFTEEFPAQVNIILVTQGDKTLFNEELTALKTTTKYPAETETTKQPTNDVNGVGRLTLPFQKTLQSLLKTSLLGALLVAFIVGFLHSLEAGHSKSILTSLMVQRQATVRYGLSYALIFTITHIADILLFGIVFLTINSFTDVYALVNQLNRYALYLLLWISLYMFLRQCIYLVHNRQDVQGTDHTHDSYKPTISLKRQLLYGFLTGLAPCVMGWSIFFVILSTRSIWAVIPVIVAFGGGIYVSLVLVTLLVYFSKKTLLSRISFLSKYSPVLSSFLLLIFSLLLLLKV